MTPIAGKLSDIHVAYSSTFYILLIARGFQGVGMGMFPIAYTIIRSQFPRNKISIGQGIITSMTSNYD